LQVDDFNFLQYVPNLKELTLGANFRVNDFSFLQFCKKLEIFNVDRAFQIEDPYPFLLLYNTNLSDLRYCENLKSLRLRGLYNLTDLTILQPCENLKFLDLRNCEKLTDLRPLQTLKNLETVDIRNCEKIEDLSPLLECPNLKRLICSHVNCMLWPYQEGLWQDHLKKLMDKGVEIVKTNDTWKAI
jgi:Leucine-rich repeat (LRR) protein